MEAAVPDYGKTKTHTLTQVNTIDQRIELIAQQVDSSQKDPWIRAVAMDVVSGTPQHGDDYEVAELVSVFTFVKSNIAYRQDPRDYDYYATARRTIQLRGGDCDDHCTLTGALLHNLGFLTGAKVISPDGYNWHIYSLAGIRSKADPSAWIALDTTQPDSRPGWEPGPEYQRHVKLVTFTGGRARIR